MEILARTIFLVLALSVASCSAIGNRYPGWQHVRIEYAVPSEDCQYKIQEACSHPGGVCYNWYKQRATVFGANTVVITHADKVVNSSSRAGVFQGSGGGRSETTTNMIALADYYHCPSKEH